MCERIVSYWADRLVKIDAIDLLQTNLPQETKQFLSRIGIPLDLAPDLLSSMKNGNHFQIKRIHYQNTAYILLFENAYRSKLCINELTGELYSLTPLGSMNFVASSVQSFAEILTIYREYTENHDDGNLRLHLQAMKEEMKAIDTRAISESGAWWFNVIEDLELSLSDFSDV